MNYFRISKYSPNQDKIVCDYEEWTSFSDLKVEQLPEYNQIECNYLAVIESILKLSKITNVTIWYLESDNSKTWCEGDILNIDETRKFISDCLKEDCWGQLIADNFIWEAGYDFYMHLGCDLSFLEITEMANELNLFVEKWTKIEKVDKS